jgi:hypothetical protein
MPLGPIGLDLRDPAGIHHGQVGAQLAADLLIGTVQLMFEEFQGQQHPRRHWRLSPCCRGGKALREAAVHGGNQRRPRKRVGPLPDRMGLRDEVGHGDLEPVAG